MTIGTREKIIDAYFELAKKYPEKSLFSMVEVAKQAGISRQAIYRNHFNNSSEIVEYIRQHIDEEIFVIFKSYNKGEDGSSLHFFQEKIIPVLYQHRDWLNCLYSTSIDPQWRNYLASKYREWLTNTLSINNTHLGISYEATVKLVVHSIINIIDVWITEDNPLPPEKFQKIFSELISTPLEHFIEE